MRVRGRHAAAKPSVQACHSGPHTGLLLCPVCRWECTLKRLQPASVLPVHWSTAGQGLVQASPLLSSACTSGQVSVRNSRAVHPTSMDAPSLQLSHPVRGFRRLSLGTLCCLCLGAAPPAQLHAHRDLGTRRHPGRSSSTPEPMNCSPQEPHLLVCSCQLCTSGSAADHLLLKADPCLHTDPQSDRLHSTNRPWRSMNTWLQWLHDRPCCSHCRVQVPA